MNFKQQDVTNHDGYRWVAMGVIEERWLYTVTYAEYAELRADGQMTELRDSYTLNVWDSHKSGTAGVLMHFEDAASYTERDVEADNVAREVYDTIEEASQRVAALMIGLTHKP